MEQIVLLAPAKLNLTLDIIGKRPDQYHLLETVMQSVTIFDKLKLTRTLGGINLSCDNVDIPTDESNIAVRSATAFFKATNADMGVDIHIEKRIPQQAGLGGGSADGASVLLGLNQLANTKLSLDKLSKIGEAVGADIPFCIYQNTAFVEGIGERVTPTKNMPHCYFVIAKPPIGISTKQAFLEIDKSNLPPINQSTMLKAINKQDINFVAKCLYNRFEQATSNVLVLQLKQAMLASGALNAIMTGSGSAVFSIFATLDKASECKFFLQKKFKHSEIFIAEPYFTE